MSKFRNEKTINELINEYEAMSQKGTVGFIEEAVFNQIVDFYLAQHKSENALEVLDIALHQHPYSPCFLTRKGSILLYQELFEEAMDALEEASVYEPGSVEIAILKVKALIELEFVNDAFEIINATKAIALGKELSQIYCYEAELYEISGKYHQMYEALKFALSVFPQNEQALEAMMWAIEMNGKYEESVEVHTHILDQYPYCDQAWFNLGHAYSGLEQYEKAAEAFEYAYLINDTNEYAYSEAAFMFIKCGQYKQALKCFKRLEKLTTLNGESLLKMGFCYESLNDLRQAKAYYDKSKNLKPQNSEVYYRIATCHSKLQKWNKALLTYKKAIQLNSRKEEYLAGLAEAYYETGSIHQAGKYFQKAADTAPETATYWLKYASFLFQCNKPITAFSILDEAQMYVEDYALLYGRCTCLFAIECEAEALYHLGELLDENFEGHSLLFEWMPELKQNEKLLQLIEKHSA